MRERFLRIRQNRYLVAAFAANSAIWSAVLAAALAFPSPYVCEWSLIIPSGDMDAHVNLVDVGQAYATSRSPYDSRSLDPRVNYRAILVSDPVLQKAARALGVEPAQFDKPQVKLIEQSSIVNLRTAAATAEQAKARAEALHRAFLERLEELRADEADQRDRGIESAISESRAKLELAQRTLVGFKVDKGIVSSRQIEDSLLRLTSLQQKRLELRAHVARGNEQVARTAASLSLDAESAGLSLALQADALFMQLFRQYSTAASEHADFDSKWGPQHPQVSGALRRKRAAVDALAARATALTRRTIDARRIEALAIPLAERAAEPLVRDLVAADVQTASVAAELATIDRQYAALKRELDGLAKQYSVLDDLERRLKFAEAVFNSALGKLDMARANIFASYPLIQLLVAPTLPERRSIERLVYALVGGLFASAFVGTGLTLAWLRRKKA